MSALGDAAVTSRVDEVLDGYAAAAMPDLIARYESFQSAVLYHPVLDLLPTQPSRIADIGAGTGRDAAWFASLGHQVVAVEPVATLRAAGRELHRDPAIFWLDDRLPDLPELAGMAPFGLVTAYGVLQHLDADAQRCALAAMTGLLAEKGRLILTLRQGPGVPGRPVFPHDTDGLVAHGQTLGLTCIRSVAKQSIKAENRALGVHWTCLVFDKKP